ncbi:hypothetical protein BM613_04030 [Sulfoacidibacillus thermotolerans]|uniref:Uncharacterized protein n=1 Tax=Sulfoacidibacillus thermotolerans TaxID=1765684 RepID=A0A2U3DAT3_SULT2|nr:hypothetical protein BM613_04030 [Sulfoacidibacillus thermotolerans]
MMEKSMRMTIVVLVLVAIAAEIPRIVQLAPGYTPPLGISQQGVALKQTLQTEEATNRKVAQMNAQLQSAIAAVENHLLVMQRDYTQHLQDLAQRGLIQLSNGS